MNKRLVADEITGAPRPDAAAHGTAALVGIPIGIALGVLAAVRQYSALDYLATGFSTAFIAIPGFVVGLVLIYVFGAN